MRLDAINRKDAKVAKNAKIFGEGLRGTKQVIHFIPYPLSLILLPLPKRELRLRAQRRLVGLGDDYQAVRVYAVGPAGDHGEGEVGGGVWVVHDRQSVAEIPYRLSPAQCLFKAWNWD